MKKTFLILTLLLVFFGCSDDDSSATYTVTFESQGGSAVTPQSVVSGDKATEPTAPTNSGYSFTAWYCESSLQTAWNFAGNTVTSNTTLYAGWTPVYLVKFFSNGGTAVPSQNIVSNGLVAEPTPPTKADNAFAGWFKDPGLTQAWDFATDRVSGATSIYARWNAAYAVSYDANGATSGGIPLNTTYHVPAAWVTVVGNLSNLVKMQDGISLRLVGWTNSSGTLFTPGTGFMMTSSPVTLYPSWTPIRGTGPGGGLVFYDNGSYTGTPAWRYLEAASADLIYAGYTNFIWGDFRTINGATNTALGSGYSNTIIIHAYMGAEVALYAARRCDLFTGGSLQDWYLPARDELQLMHQNLYTPGVGNFQSEAYWSSSQISTNTARAVLFQNGGNEMTYVKSVKLLVRPVRRF